MSDIRKDIIAKAYEVRDVTRKSIEPFKHLSEKEMADVVQTKEFGEARLKDSDILWELFMLLDELEAMEGKVVG